MNSLQIESNWKDVAEALTKCAKKDVGVEITFTNGNSAQRAAVHQRMHFYARFSRAPPAFVAPPGIVDPGAGVTIHANFASSARFVEFLAACHGINWGHGGRRGRFTMSVERPGGGYSTAALLIY